MSYHIHVSMCLMIILGAIVSFRFRPLSPHLLHILYESLAVRSFPKVPINRFAFFCLREPFTKHHPTLHPPLTHAQTRTQVILVGSLYEKFQTSKPNQTVTSDRAHVIHYCAHRKESNSIPPLPSAHTHIPHLR